MLKELLNLNQPAVDSNCLMRVASVHVHFPTLYICECEVTDTGRITMEVMDRPTLWCMWRHDPDMKGVSI